MKLAAALLGSIVLAGTQAAAPARPVPAAANTIAGKPEAFYGQTVSVTAAVGRLLSSSAFVIYQARPGAPTTNCSSSSPHSQESSIRAPTSPSSVRCCGSTQLKSRAV